MTLFFLQVVVTHASAAGAGVGFFAAPAAAAVVVVTKGGLTGLVVVVAVSGTRAQPLLPLPLLLLAVPFACATDEALQAPPEGGTVAGTEAETVVEEGRLATTGFLARQLSTSIALAPPSGPGLAAPLAGPAKVVCTPTETLDAVLLVSGPQKARRGSTALARACTGLKLYGVVN